MGAEKSRRGFAIPPAVWVIAAGIVCLVPFVNKAFHIDDTLFIYAARQIQHDPVNFYNFWVNWYGTNSPMWETMQNPPLASYYIALVARLFGESEVVLHLAFLLPAAGVIWGTYRLAEQFCTRPVLATLATLLTPAFLVSSTNVMCDTLTLCFWVWAVVLWERGLRRRQMLLLYLAALLICGAALTKYIGVALIPLLLAYTLAYPWGRGNRLMAALSWSQALVVPLLVLWFYQWATQTMYGHGLFFQAAGYAASIRDSWNALFHAFLLEGLFTLCFLGGGVVSLLFYLPLLWSWRVLLAGFALTTLLSLGLAWGFAKWPTLNESLPFGQPAGTIPWLGLAQFALFVAAGFGLMGLTVLDLCTRRDAASLLLALWIAGIFVFATFLNWTVNVRSILPLVPAAGILIARRLDHRFGPAERPTKRGADLLQGGRRLDEGCPPSTQVQEQLLPPVQTGRRAEERFAPPGRIAEQGPARRLGARRREERFAPPGHIAKQGSAPSIRAGHLDDRIKPAAQVGARWLVLPLVPAAVLALLVTWADYQMAGAARAAATDIVAHCQDHAGRVWYQGHWGFQYYMDRAGITPLEFLQVQSRPGDLVIYPGNNANVDHRAPPWPWVHPYYYQLDIVPCPWLASMDQSVGAGFYAGVFGPLPFAFGEVHPTHYDVIELAPPRRNKVAP